MFPNKRPHRLVLSAVVFALALAQAPRAQAQQEADDSALYNDCIAKAESDPSGAHEQAVAWTAQGGGDPARHCAALALIQLGHYEEAAARLEELAQTMNTEELRLRVEALAQAAQAWLLAGKQERAFANQTAALKLAPENLELLVDRSIVLAAASNYRAALLDLDRAHQLSPERADVLVYRATVHRYLDSPESAMRDIQGAIRLAPDLPEAYLERGILKRLNGDRNGARRDWVKVLQLDAETPAADAARVNLELLDVDPDASLQREKPLPSKLGETRDPGLNPPATLSATRPPPRKPERSFPEPASFLESATPKRNDPD